MEKRLTVESGLHNRERFDGAPSVPLERGYVGYMLCRFAERGGYFTHRSAKEADC